MFKKLLLTISLILSLAIGTTLQAQVYNYNTNEGVSYKPYIPVTHRNVQEILLDDGVYQTKVTYLSHTGHKARYTLNVKIVKDKVVAILFPEGGSVHTGYNNHDYTYEGGGVEYQFDYMGEISGARAAVNVYYSNNKWQHFEMEIL